MIIGLLGRAGSGKTTCAKWLARNYGAELVSFAQPLKEMAAMIMEFEPHQLYGTQIQKEEPGRYGISGREVCQRLGCAARKVLGPSIWVRSALEQTSTTGITAIDDVRFPNESRGIKIAGGIVVKLEAIGEPVTDPNAESEVSVDDPEHQYDVLIKAARGIGVEGVERLFAQEIRPLLAEYRVNTMQPFTRKSFWK